MNKKGFLLIVALMVLLGGAFYLTPALAAGPYQAENAVVQGGATVNSNFAGFLGTGFVNFNWSGGYVEFRNVDGGAGGSATLKLRHALGSTNPRDGRLTVNGANQIITFNPTGAWTTWAVKEVSVTLTPGMSNTIRLASTGQDLANLDQMEVQVTPVCEQPAPIYASIIVSPTNLQVNGIFNVSLTTTLGNPMITLYAGNDVVATCSGNCESGLTVVDGSPMVQFVSVNSPFFFKLKAIAAGTTPIYVTVQGEDTIYRFDPEVGACRPFPVPGVSGRSQTVQVTALTTTLTPLPCGAPIPLASASLSVTPTTLEVGGITQASFSSNLGMPQYVLYDGSNRIAVFQYGGGVDVYNESPVVRLLSGDASPAVLEAFAPGTADLKVTANGEIVTAWGPGCTPIYNFVTVASSTVPVTVSTGIPTLTPTPTSGPVPCSPAMSTISVPFTVNGAGTFCWQTSSLGSYINSWNVDSLTINGIEYGNRWLPPPSPYPPPPIDGKWYIGYRASVPWAHFEMK